MIESLSFSIILVDLFCMHVMRVGLDSSGFINGNGIRIAQACPISIIPWSVKASKNASILQEIFYFLLFLHSRGSSRGSLFHCLLPFYPPFNHPNDLLPKLSFFYNLLPLSIHSAMLGYLSQSAKQESSIVLWVFLGGIFSKTLMLILLSTISHVSFLFASFEYFLIFLL